MSEESVKKIDDINNRVIRLEERLPLQIQHLSGTIDDFRNEIGDAIRKLTDAVKDQAGIHLRLSNLEDWKLSMQEWKDKMNKYVFAAFVVGVILVWFLNQFVGPLINSWLS